MRGKMFIFMYLLFSVYAVCMTVLPEVRDIMRLNYHVQSTLQNTLHHSRYEMVIKRKKIRSFSLIFRGMSLYFDLVAVTTAQEIFLLSRW